jgi:hypothetical protein
MNFFLFSRWNFGYHGAFLTNSLFFHDGTSAIREPFSRTTSFFTMEFRLSGSLSHEPLLFSRWNSGYYEAFFTNFFFFSRWNFGYHGAFLTNHFFFHDGILAITKPFSRTFSFSHDGIFETQNTKHAIWGKTLFIYISERVFT